MFVYRVFGGELHSDLEFPSLPPAPAGVPDWTLTSVDRLPEEGARLAEIGREWLGRRVEAALFRGSDSYHLAFGNFGTFRISGDGAQILWCPGVDALPEPVRQLFLGRVLAAALHARGVFCLHGSAVELAGRAIGFLGPKLHGKSTLAFALMKAGARLMTDDTLPVGIDPPRAFPGVHAVRLREDSAREVAGHRQAIVNGPLPKVELGGFEEAQVRDDPVPLSALYVLARQRAGGIASVAERERVPPVAAALSLVRHAKLGGLLGGSEAVVTLDRATRLARAVPIFALSIPRRFQELPAVTGRLLEWHAATSETGGPWSGQTGPS